MCSKMENECFKNEDFKDFKEFKKTSPYIWCYGETPYADTIYKFCRGIKSNWRQDVKLNGYPYCCFYWKVNDFLTIYVNSSGRLDCLPIDGNTSRGGVEIVEIHGGINKALVQGICSPIIIRGFEKWR